MKSKTAKPTIPTSNSSIFGNNEEIDSPEAVIAVLAIRLNDIVSISLVGDKQRAV
jgi:hypothetical protein